MLGDLDFVSCHDKRLQAAPESIFLGPHNSFGVDPTEIRIEPLVGGNFVAFRERRHYGFVRGDDGSEAFFHRTELTTVDFDSLEEGESVTFEVVDSPKGPRARNLQKVG